MNIALIGYGKMGKAVELQAKARGHIISLIVDKDNLNDFTAEKLANSDVAIEFSTPDTAYENFLKCFDADIPVVSGTTGWLDKKSEIEEICKLKSKAFFYASNFSLGVNLVFEINKIIARLVGNLPEYEVSISEMHHIHKLDAPSGTAITLAEGIIENIEHKNSWVSGKSEKRDQVSVESVREGEIFGIHRVDYNSACDIISLRHEAKNRDGLAIGAVLAAEFVKDKKGFFGMNDLLKF